MNKETFEKLVKVWTRDITSKEECAIAIINGFIEYQAILDRINAWRKKKSNAELEYRKLKDQLDCEIQDIRDKCPHYLSHTSDADRFCDMCGAEL